MDWLEVAKYSPIIGVVVGGFCYVFKLQAELWGNHSKHLTESVDKLTEAVTENTEALIKHTAYSKGKANS